MAPAWLLFVNFHHVHPDGGGCATGLHFRSPAQVKAQVEALARRFDFPAPAEVRTALCAGTPLARDACVLTFDDGLRDHHEVVLPLLGELGVRAVFAVNTGFWEDGRLLSVHMAHLLSAAFPYAALGGDFERAARARGAVPGLVDVDEVDAVRQYRYDRREDALVKHYINAVLAQDLREQVVGDVFRARVGDEESWARRHYMTPAMAAGLAAAGHTLALHSHRHVNLRACPRALRRADLAANRTALAAAAGGEIRWISYPYGSPASWDAEVVADAAALGCDVGLTMTRGANRMPGALAMTLRRVDTNDVEGGKAPLAWSELLA